MLRGLDMLKFDQSIFLKNPNLEPVLSPRDLNDLRRVYQLLVSSLAKLKRGSHSR